MEGRAAKDQSAPRWHIAASPGPLLCSHRTGLTDVESRSFHRTLLQQAGKERVNAFVADRVRRLPI